MWGGEADDMASLAGFEPATRCLEGSCSVQTELQGRLSSTSVAVFAGRNQATLRPVLTQWMVILPMRAPLTACTDTPSESGRVVKCRCTKAPTRRFKASAAMTPIIDDPNLVVMDFDRPCKTHDTDKAMKAPARIFVPQYGDTARCR